MGGPRGNFPKRSDCITSGAIFRRPKVGCVAGWWLVETEVYFHINHYWNSLSVFACGIKLPLLHGFDSFLIEAHTQRALDADLLRTPTGIHDQPQNHGALVFRLTRFFRILRIG